MVTSHHNNRIYTHPYIIIPPKKTSEQADFVVFVLKIC